MSKSNLKPKGIDSKIKTHEGCTKCTEGPAIRRTLKAESRKKARQLISSVDIDDSTNLPHMVEKLCKCDALARALKYDLASTQGMSNRRADIDAMCDLCADEPVCRKPKEGANEENKDGKKENNEKIENM